MEVNYLRGACDLMKAVILYEKCGMGVRAM